MSGAQPLVDYYRYCPGEEQIKLSNAICRGRRHAHYPKCPGCQFNDDENRTPSPSSPQSRAKSVAIIESLFRPHDILGIHPFPLSDDAAWRIGHACGQYLHGRLRGFDRANPSTRSLVVGRDNRPHSEELEKSLIAGIQSTGIDVVRIGVVDTPQLYFAVVHFGGCGGIQVTGGRHSAEYNGFKICAAKAFPIASETGLYSIRDMAVRVPPHRTGVDALLTSLDLTGRYRDFILRSVPSAPALPRPLKIVVDAGGGVGGHWFDETLGHLQGVTTVKLNEPREGAPPLPNMYGGSVTPELRKAVKELHADFGLRFDGDADRCEVVDERGLPVPPDLLAALIARRFIEREPGACVVFDHRFSSAAVEEIQRAGGVLARERVGHVFIKKTMTDRQAVFGADLSGRHFFRDASFCENALLGAACVINLLIESGRKLSELIRPLAKYRTSGEVRVPCDDPEQTIRTIAAAHQEAEIEYLDGVTVRYPDWWFNLRSPEADGVLNLTIEARTKKLVDERLGELQQQISPQA